MNYQVEQSLPLHQQLHQSLRHLTQHQLLLLQQMEHKLVVTV
jgi:hypothetical protein